MIKETVTIINKLGLHARAAAKFVATTSRFTSDIQVFKHTQQVNGKSIMGVMMLAASQGTELELEINGEDELDAREAVVGLINNRFDEAE
jgi:phosphocarrier protein